MTKQTWRDTYFNPPLPTSQTKESARQRQVFWEAFKAGAIITALFGLPWLAFMIWADIQIYNLWK